jgi:hypothetical protein
MDEVKKFFGHFPNPWTLRVSGMGCYTSKCEKKSKSLHPNGYPGATKINPPVLEGPIELLRHIGSFWSSGDYPWAILGAVVDQ